MAEPPIEHPEGKPRILPITLQYSINEDIIARFIRYSYKNTPSSMRRILLQWLGTPFILLIIGLTWPLFFDLIGRVALTTENLLESLSLCAVISLIWLACFPFLLNWRISRWAKQQVEDGENKAMLAPQTLTVDEEGLCETNEFSKQAFKWTTIERIGASTEDIYLYYSSNAAVIIPSSAFESSGEKDKLIAILKDLHRKSLGRGRK